MSQGRGLMLAHAPWTEKAIWDFYCQWFEKHRNFGAFARYPDLGLDVSEIELTKDTRPEDFNWKRLFVVVLRDHPKARTAARINAWCKVHGAREDRSLADLVRMNPGLGSESQVRRRRRFAVRSVLHVLNNRIAVVQAIEHLRRKGRSIPAELLQQLQPSQAAVERIEEEVGLAA